MTDEWIDVKDKLPRVGEWVLMYLTKYEGVGAFQTALFMDEDEWLSSKEVLRKGDVSHWQQLPPAPKEGASEATTAPAP